MNRNSLTKQLVECPVTCDFHTTLEDPVTTLHDVEGVLGRPLDTFFWALLISWSRILWPLHI